MTANAVGAAELWQDRYDEAAQFHAAHGRLPKQREAAAGKWLARQRELARAGKLPAERAERLATLPGFAVDARGAGHDGHLAAVREFVATHGRLPGRKMPGMAEHGQWLHDIRSGKVCPPAAVMAALEQLGFTMTPVDDVREEFLARYAAYVDTYQTSWVAKGFVCEDGYPLGERCRIRRAAAAAGTLGRDVHAELSAVGFPWTAPAFVHGAPQSEA